MYKSQYDITPRSNNPVEERMKRDLIQFPNALPSNSQEPLHKMDYNFTDRYLKNDRKQRDQLPVQNNYLQRYQIHELQQSHHGYTTIEQSNIDRIMTKKIINNGGLLDRNRDDAVLFGRENPIIRPEFGPMATDTRREKIDLNNDRTPMAKVFGGPSKYTDNK